MAGTILTFVIAMKGGIMFLDTNTGEQISIEKITQIIGSYDVVIFGEKHDSKDCHRAELDLLKVLSLKYPIIFSLEMFEKDVQSVLDDYISGKIKEEVFLEKARPWSNYKEDYRPLIEWCKENKIKVIAANVPRYIASMVAKEGLGILDSLSQRDKEYIADTIFYENPEYRERFYNIVGEVHMPNFTEKMKENYYKAQCIKDATMAESIIRVFKKYGGKYKIFHINGSFHSDYHEGVVWQLHKMDPSIRVLVISPIKKGDKVEKRIGDFIFYYER